MVNVPEHNQAKRRQKSLEIDRSVKFLVAFIGLFALYAAMTVVLFWQWMPHLQSALIGPPEDNMQDFWNTWYATIARNQESFFLLI